ncbi:MAG: succinate dehydrogenase, partial [Bacteroidota bacterium]
LADPVYAVLWKAFNILFLVFALHHGFYGLNNIITDYVRNDMARVGAVALSWTVAFGLLVIGVYSVTVAGLNL